MALCGKLTGLERVGFWTLGQLEFFSEGMVLFILVDTWHRLSVKSMPLEERARSTSQRPDR